MSLLCLGLSHQSAPIQLRERVAISAGQLPDSLQQLHQQDGIDEIVILSTCNRTELYLVGDHNKLHRLGENYMRERGQLNQHESLPIYSHSDSDAAMHLCRVTGGLESMVLGETEILGQTKQAYQQAQAHKHTAGTLNRLFQHSFRIAKKLRTHTEIQRGATSVAAVAVELAERIFGELNDCKTMVLGAGDTSRQMAKALASRGVRSQIVSNRNRERALQLAEEINAEAVPFDQWKSHLHQTDILLAATGAPHALIHKSDLAPILKRRRRPLFAIDIAVPRDIDPSVNQLSNVYLYDLDSIEAAAAQNRESRHAQIRHCEEIIREEIANKKILRLPE